MQVIPLRRETSCFCLEHIQVSTKTEWCCTKAKGVAFIDSVTSISSLALGVCRTWAKLNAYGRLTTKVRNCTNWRTHQRQPISRASLRNSNKWETPCITKVPVVPIPTHQTIAKVNLNCSLSSDSPTQTNSPSIHQHQNYYLILPTKQISL